MKILLINNEYPPLGGGAANATLFMAKSLVTLGHEPVVLTSGMQGLSPYSEDDGIRVYRIPTLRRAAARTDILEMTMFMLHALRAAPRIARSEAAKGVVAFFTIPCGPVAWMLKRMLGLPYIVSLRGGDVPGHVPEIRHAHRLITPLRRLALRGARAVVANAPGLARLSERMDPVPVKIIPNGVDAGMFHPGSWPSLAGGPFRILFVGRLHELKNIDMLLRAVAALSAEGAEMHLDIVGDGPQRAELVTLAATLGLGERITWHGWSAKPDVARLYRTASCFVNPSRYEGMPNTVLEAMASGLPVVASNVGGNNDLVVTGQTGYLFELAAPEGLLDALRSLNRDPEMRAQMGARARDVVVSQYSWTQVTSRYVELLTDEASRVRDGVPPLSPASRAVEDFQ